MTTRQLTKRFENYIYKNKKLSPLGELEYHFTKALYQYLTKQETGPAIKEHLYDLYIGLINVCYSGNKANMCKDWVNIIYDGINLIIDREYSGPRSFIILNDRWHYLHLRKAIDYIKEFSEDPQYYSFADFGEFYTVVDLLRTEFNHHKIDIPSAVGKWPRKDRKRFGREPDKPTKIK